MKFTTGDEYTKSKIEIQKTKLKNLVELISLDFTGHNILNVSMIQNGKDYGDSGKGPFVKIRFQNKGCTQMYLNGNETDQFIIEFKGISERNQIVSALELLLKELK